MILFLELYSGSLSKSDGSVWKLYNLAPVLGSSILHDSPIDFTILENGSFTFCASFSLLFEVGGFEVFWYRRIFGCNSVSRMDQFSGC